jgi:hypothetical protein
MIRIHLFENFELPDKNNKGFIKGVPYVIPTKEETEMRAYGWSPTFVDPEEENLGALMWTHPDFLGVGYPINWNGLNGIVNKLDIVKDNEGNLIHLIRFYRGRRVFYGKQEISESEKATEKFKAVSNRYSWSIKRRYLK